MDQEPIDLTAYHAIYIQISGGKDSQVSLTRIRQLAREQGVLRRTECRKEMYTGKMRGAGNCHGQKKNLFIVPDHAW